MSHGLTAALAALALAAAGAASPAAVPPAGYADRLADPAQEARAHALFRQFRCLVCQNESIDDSDAPLAADLRARVRADITAGRSDTQVRRELVDRYGEFVLLKPRLSAGNAVLWLLPFLIVAAGLAAFARPRRPAPSELALTEAEQRRVSALAAAATVPPPLRPTDTTRAV